MLSDPINPFTGKPINSSEKTAHDQFIICSHEADILKNNGNTFLPSKWASVHDNVWDKSNWTFYDDDVVLTTHAAP